MRTPEDIALIDAINLLSQYAERHLPDGYYVELRFGKDDCGICVIDPDGEDVFVDCDSSIATFRAACRDARDDARSQMVEASAYRSL